MSMLPLSLQSPDRQQFIPTKIVGVAFPLRWLNLETPALHDRCLLLCSLGPLSPSCRFLVTFCKFTLWANTTFRLHGITCCQAVWYLRTQSDRSSKSMKAFVRLTIKLMFPKTKTTHSNILYRSGSFGRLVVFLFFIFDYSWWYHREKHSTARSWFSRRWTLFLVL